MRERFYGQLTKKFRKRIYGYCHSLKIPPDDGMHIAEIFEWELEKKIEDLEGRERYFNKALKHQLMRHLGLDSFWCKKEREGKRDLDWAIDDGAVKMRSFYAVGYDRLTQHICYMLSMSSDVEVEMFLLRIHTEMRWSKMKKEVYPELSRREFDRHVKEIRKVALESAVHYKGYQARRGEWISLLK